MRGSSPSVTIKLLSVALASVICGTIHILICIPLLFTIDVASDQPITVSYSYTCAVSIHCGFISAVSKGILVAM